MRRPILYISQILEWADAFHERMGRWPKHKDGRIGRGKRDTWQAISLALSKGHRGLVGGSSLPKLLAEWRGVRNIHGLPPLTFDQVLVWADRHYGKRGAWPDVASGPIAEAPGETWQTINHALGRGRRGLPADGSLARLLAERRGVRNQGGLERLTIAGILGWADAHRRQTGKWPNLNSGPVLDAPGETWPNISSALNMGTRGLPGGTTLARLLAEHRRARNRKELPHLRVAGILSWADEHHRRTGRWPTHKSGPVVDAEGETWAGVESALRAGVRGLPGGSSLQRLLAAHRRKKRWLRSAENDGGLRLC